MRLTFILLLAITLPAAVFAAPEVAHAISLPDNSSCGAASSNGCFKVTNNTAGGIASTGVTVGTGGIGVSGTATGTGVGVSGNSASYIGVLGSTAGGVTPAIWGIVSGAGTGHGVRGDARTNDSSGVLGANSNGGFGVRGEVPANAPSGAAVYGDANSSFAAWAGEFEGDIHVTRDAIVDNDINAGRQVTAAGLVLTSDARMKTDVGDLSYGLQQLLKLRPVTYRWKESAISQEKQIGLIAQEVQKVVPEAVHVNRHTGMLGINYIELLPVMIRGLQEQQTTIQQQQARILKLEQERATTLSAAVPLGGIAALGLLPIGIAFARRRRDDEKRG
jgi:hypothetical protein